MTRRGKRSTYDAEKIVARAMAAAARTTAAFEAAEAAGKPRIVMSRNLYAEVYEEPREAPRSRRGRSKVDRAQSSLQRLYPDGVPGGASVKALQTSVKAESGEVFLRDVISRALARLR